MKDDTFMIFHLDKINKPININVKVYGQIPNNISFFQGIDAVPRQTIPKNLSSSSKLTPLINNIFLYTFHVDANCQSSMLIFDLTFFHSLSSMFTQYKHVCLDFWLRWSCVDPFVTCIPCSIPTTRHTCYVLAHYNHPIDHCWSLVDINILFFL